MERMKDDLKSSIDQLSGLRGVLFISCDVSVEQSVQEAIFVQQSQRS